MKNNFTKKILKNGITLLFEKRDVPVVSIIVAIKSGGNSEDLSQKGISHFVEHMLYKGTKTRTARKIAEDIERNGGELNGFTSEEITGFWCKMPQESYEIGLDVLIDMVKNPLFDEKEMEKERKVIFEEIKLYHDNPLRHIFNEIQKCLYSGALKISLIGTNETMNSIDRRKILQRFQETYTSKNLVVCIVGDADINKIEKLFNSSFEEKTCNDSLKKIILKNEIKVEKRKGIDQANLVFGYHAPLASDKKSIVALILNTILAGGMSSRLFSEIREKRNLAYAVKSGSEIAKDFSYNWIYVGTNKENTKEVEELILKEFKKVSESLDEKELNSVKKQLVGNYHISMEDSQIQMVNLLASEIHTKAEDFYDFEKEINKVKLADVKEMASKVKKGNYSLFILEPEN
ncbi:MAG: pitrilysin family protein [Candidatus Pacearchaeota archaeon]|jgi:predicted Zn-dependent peptidase